MYQPKSLAELARIAINKSIVSVPHLRDLALPPRLIRELEETIAEDRLDLEKQLAGCTTADDLFNNLQKLHMEEPFERVTRKELAAIRKYPEEGEPFIRLYPFHTIIFEWITFTYADRTYKVCWGCDREHRGPQKQIVHYGKKSICDKHEIIRHIKNRDNWCQMCFCMPLFYIDEWIHTRNIDEEMEFVAERKPKEYFGEKDFYICSSNEYDTWSEEHELLQEALKHMCQWRNCDLCEVEKRYLKIYREQQRIRNGEVTDEVTDKEPDI